MRGPGQNMKLLGTMELLEITAKLITHEGLELITAGKLEFLELEKIKKFHVHCCFQLHRQVALRCRLS